MGRENSRRVNRREVAAAAGVSEVAVSQALSDYPGSRLAAATRVRIKAAAKRLGYRPNYGARAMVTGKSSTIGLLQPSPLSIFHTVYQHILYGLVKHMQADDHHLLTLFRDEEQSFLRLMEQGRIDGLIIIQSDWEDRDVEAAVATGLPVLVVNRDIPTKGRGNLGCVNSDLPACMGELVDTLRSAGRSRLLELNRLGLCDCNDRLHEVFTTLVPNGTTLDFRDARWEEQLLARLTDPKQKRPDGLIVMDVYMVEQIVTIATEAGLKAGVDFDMVLEHSFSGYQTPSGAELAIFCANLHQVGCEAWTLLRGMIAGRVRCREVKVPYVKQAAREGPVKSVMGSTKPKSREKA